MTDLLTSGWDGLLSGVTLPSTFTDITAPVAVNNSQNTVAGTSGGGAIADPNGNPFLNAIANISNIAITGLADVSSFRERLALNNAQVAQANLPPGQTLPQYLSNTGNVQNLIIWGVVALIGYVVFKVAVKS